MGRGKEGKKEIGKERESERKRERGLYKIER